LLDDVKLSKYTTLLIIPAYDKQCPVLWLATRQLS